MNAEAIQQPPQLSNTRLVFLGLSSVILVLSYIMAIFAPLPLVLASVLYGRVKGFLTGFAGMALSFAFASNVYQDLTLLGFYVGVFVIGMSIAEIILRGISPIKGIVAFGTGFILLVSVSFLAYLDSQKLTAHGFAVRQLQKSSEFLGEYKKIMEQSPDPDAIQVLQLLEHPELIAKEMMTSVPSLFFMSVFLMLWFNMFMALKSRRLLMSGNDYPYSEKTLLNFKVPFAVVYLLTLGIVLAVWGADLFGDSGLETIGMNIIKCLGVFYFFQGFGVFSDLLSFLGIGGMLRPLIVVLVVFSASYLVAVAGLFDNWFDFRKYFVRPKTED